MVDIRHRVGIQADPEKVYAALTTQDGLAGWWTKETTVLSAKQGGKIEFRFGGGGCDVAIEALRPKQEVRWKVVAGPEDWVGTTIQFDLQPNEREVAVLFQHRDWRAPNDFMAHCSMKWGVFLMSLKKLAEQGRGLPYPEDPHITATN